MNPTEPMSNQWTDFEEDPVMVDVYDSEPSWLDDVDWAWLGFKVVYGLYFLFILACVVVGMHMIATGQITETTAP